MNGYDDGVPDNKATLRVNIRVIRNEGFPQFIFPQFTNAYEVTINEFHQLSQLVVNVTAVDNVDNVSFTLINNCAIFWLSNVSGNHCKL